VRFGSEAPVPGAPRRIADLVDHAARHRLSITAAAIVRAAERRRIVCRSLDGNGLLVLGEPPHVRLVNGTLTSSTLRSAVQLAKDKHCSGQVLAAAGLPVPLRKLATSFRDAQICAEQIGYPVVVKPRHGSHGRGVSINMKTSGAVRSAFDRATKFGPFAVVERRLVGDDFRFLVIDDVFVAAARLKPPVIIGDGVHTVEELVQSENSDPRRGAAHENVLTALTIDVEASGVLGEQGYFAESVPSRGTVVKLRNNANLSTGGVSIDVTESVHPDNKEMAVSAVRAIGLDVGGVDFITTDVSESYRSSGGAVCEVNASPGLRMHLAPAEGEPRDVAEPIVEMLFPGSACA
jgi:cyanophycin synthetase